VLQNSEGGRENTGKVWPVFHELATLCATLPKNPRTMPNGTHLVQPGLHLLLRSPFLPLQLLVYEFGDQVGGLRVLEVQEVLECALQGALEALLQFSKRRKQSPREGHVSSDKTERRAILLSSSTPVHLVGTRKAATATHPHCPQLIMRGTVQVRIPTHLNADTTRSTNKSQCIPFSRTIMYSTQPIAAV
jgi:hypothetical protein